MVGGSSMDQLVKAAKAAGQSVSINSTSSGYEVRIENHRFYFDSNGEYRDYTDTLAAGRIQRKR